jgi:hypothetical protein
MKGDVMTRPEMVMSMIVEDPRRPQEAVYILQTPPRSNPREYLVVHARANQHLVFQQAGGGVTFTEAKLDKELVDALVRSWGTMARHARWPDRDRTSARMKGGTVYTFDYIGDNIYGQGDTVSPESDTCSGALVDVSDLLIRFVDEEDDTRRRAVRIELLRQARALAERVERG